MPRVWPIQNQFTAGELSPRLHGRTDLAQYYQGCKTLRNWLVMPQGGVTKRAGTRFVAEVKDHAHTPRLLPFVFGVEQAYVIEIGHTGSDGYMRFFRDQGQIQSGGGPVEITSPPWQEAELLEVMVAQSADTMYLAHPAHPPKVLTRSSHLSWTLSDYTVAPGKDPSPPFTSSGNYPGAVTFIQQRLAWAASHDNPQRIWLSRIGDFTDLLAGTDDADAFDATVASPRVNVGRWLLGSKGLFFGTAGAIWRINTDAITPSNFPLKRVSSTGCSYRGPLDIDDSVIYVERHGDPTNQGRKVDALRFSLETDDFATQDISIVSEHILRSGIRDIAWQEQPNRVLWVVCQDGTLCSCTYFPRQQIVGWARHVLGGSDAAVESVAVIPGERGDEVWLVVRRSIAGNTRRYIEVIDPDDGAGNVFVDAALVGASATPTAIWSGLGHLEGETVAVRADQAPVAPKLVQAGMIELDEEASQVEIGLAYEAVLESTNLEAGAADGTAQGRRKTISRMILTLADAGGIKAKASGGAAFDEVEFRDVQGAMDTAIPLFSGPIALKPPSGWSQLGTITVTSDTPLPATILSLVTRAEVND